MNNIRNNLKTVILVIMCELIIIAFGLIDLNSKLMKYKLYVNFKCNIKFIINLVNKGLPILIILIMFIFYKILNKRWVFRVEKINLGGLNIIFDDPDKLFKQQVKNFLNTKRTLFKIDEKRDNFYQTLDSYYEVYNFLREELKIFDVKSSKYNEGYKIANDMMQHLNEFLTKHQNNFRRWYEYINKNNLDEIYDKDIYDIQKDYRHYDLMIEDFKKINKFFIQASSIFEIDIRKWQNF